MIKELKKIGDGTTEGLLHPQIISLPNFQISFINYLVLPLQYFAKA